MKLLCSGSFQISACDLNITDSFISWEFPVYLIKVSSYFLLAKVRIDKSDQLILFHDDTAVKDARTLQKLPAELLLRNILSVRTDQYAALPADHIQEPVFDISKISRFKIWGVHVFSDPAS